MSYVVHVWQHPANQALPTDIVDADQWLDRLSDVSGQASPHFKTLAQRLNDRFPCEESFDDDDSCAWPEGPLCAGENPVWVIAVQASLLEEVIPVMAQEANALGLILFDMQSGSAYLPNGQVLGQRFDWEAIAKQKKAYPDDLKPFDSKREPFAVYTEMMTPILAPLGFKLDKTFGFYKEYPEIRQKLSFHSQEGYLHCFKVSMTISLEARLKPSEFTTQIQNQRRPGVGMQLSELFRLAPAGATAPSWRTPKSYDPENYLFIAQNAQELRAHLQPIAQYYKEVVIPVLNRCITFQGVHECINHDDRSKRIVPIRRLGCLFFAHLAKSPDVPRLAETITTLNDALSCPNEFFWSPEFFAKVVSEKPYLLRPETTKTVATALDTFEKAPYPWR